MDKDIKVGDIVYWYPENEDRLNQMPIIYPYLRYGYGVVEASVGNYTRVFYPSSKNRITLSRMDLHKVEIGNG